MGLTPLSHPTPRIQKQKTASQEDTKQEKEKNHYTPPNHLNQAQEKRKTLKLDMRNSVLFKLHFYYLKKETESDLKNHLGERKEYMI